MQELIPTFPGTPDPDFQINEQLTSLPGMVVDCINKCDVDIRRELYNGAILTGLSEHLVLRSKHN